MAEGGFDFENPTFDEDDYDEDIDDILPMVPDETDQRIISNQSGAIDDLRGELRKSAVEAQKKRLVRTFYDEIEKRYKMVTDKIDYDQFKISDDGKTLFWIVGDKEIRITAKRGSAEFLSLGTLANEYNRIVGKGGTLAVRQYLNLPDYKSKTQLSQEVRHALESTRNDMPDLESSSGTELQDLTNTVIGTETAVKSLETSLTDWIHTDTQTEGLTLRELQGLDKALQRTRGELTNNLAKLTELDKDIARQKQKLQEAEEDEATDEITKRDIRSRINNLEDERDARLEAASANKEELRGQINRIKETIDKVLKEDTTLRERLKTLFKEQGITIISILTAIGMIIGDIVEAVIPTTGGTGTTPPKPPSKEGVKDWVKKQLQNLARLLANLAGKAAAALPGIIGFIVSWLLSATGKVVNWFGNNLWALVVLVVGLLYAAAKEWIN